MVKIGAAGADRGTIQMLGGVRNVQFEHIELSLPHDPSYAWTARVAFTIDPTFQMPFQGVLGTEGFLDRWAVTFNKYFDYFEIMRPDEA
jgi:hypothetical protein